MKNVVLTVAQVFLVFLWIILGWNLEPYNPWSFIQLPNIDGVFAVIIAFITLIPAFGLQTLKDKQVKNDNVNTNSDNGNHLEIDSKLDQTLSNIIKGTAPQNLKYSVGHKIIQDSDLSIHQKSTLSNAFDKQLDEMSKK